MAKILCVLYDDPIDGYPKSYPRDDLPKIDHYPGGQTLPTPNSIDFKPGALLGSVSGELGLRTYLESLGHTFIVTSDKEGPNSRFERELPDAEIVISQPFWPAYLTPNASPRRKTLNSQSPPALARTMSTSKRRLITKLRSLRRARARIGIAPATRPRDQKKRPSSRTPVDHLGASSICVAVWINA
jgi:hypothetical protein